MKHMMRKIMKWKMNKLMDTIMEKYAEHADEKIMWSKQITEKVVHRLNKTWLKHMMKLMTHKNPIETYDDKYDGTRHETWNLI